MMTLLNKFHFILLLECVKISLQKESHLYTNLELQSSNAIQIILSDIERSRIFEGIKENVEEHDQNWFDAITSFDTRMITCNFGMIFSDLN